MASSFVRDAHRALEAQLGGDPSPDVVGDRDALAAHPVDTRHVEKRLVEGYPFDERREVLEDPVQLGTERRVAVVTAGHEHR